jgi:hypothetical protein
LRMHALREQVVATVMELSPHRTHSPKARFPLGASARHYRPVGKRFTGEARHTALSRTPEWGLS